MGGSTVAVGLLPGAATIGVAAPIVLVLLRFAQGLAVGGEWGGAALLAAEYAPPGRRGRFTMYPQLGPGAAFALTSATFLIIGLTMKPADVRSPGAGGSRSCSASSCSASGCTCGCASRRPRCSASSWPASSAARTPIREALRRQEPRPILLGGGALSAVFAFGYIGTVYLTSYGTAVLGLPRPIMLLLGIIGGGVLRRRGRGRGALVRSRRAAPGRADRQRRVGRRRPRGLRGDRHRPRSSASRSGWSRADLARRRVRTRPGRGVAVRAVRRPLPLHRRRSRLQLRRDPRRRGAAGLAAALQASYGGMAVGVLLSAVRRCSAWSARSPCPRRRHRSLQPAGAALRLPT